MNKVAIITGATRGLGLSYAHHLATLGYNLGLMDISSSACSVYDSHTIEEVMASFKGYPVRVKFFEADLTSQNEAAKAIHKCHAEFGHIDGVIANAGGDISGKDQAAAGGKAQNNNFFIEASEWENIFSRNFDTCMNTLRAVVPILKNQKSGKIVTVSSVNATFGVMSETAYSVAKCAIIQLTRCLAAQLREDGINVNCLMPGPTKTSRFMSTLKGRNEHDLKAVHSDAKLNRAAREEDIVPVAGFLLSDAARFISGQIIRVDGGLFTHPI